MRKSKRAKIWKYVATVLYSVLFIMVCFLAVSVAHAGSWYAGSWDSTIYNRSDRPLTIGVRIEVLDAETQMPVRDVSVMLVGSYLEERIGTSGDEVGIPYEPQEREFKLKATTARHGVVVFALNWQKKYPWSFGRPKPKKRRGGSVVTYDVHTSWKRAVDDVEIIRKIEVRHSRYRFRKMSFDFKHLVEFGQDTKTELQEPRIFNAFEKAWIREMRRPGVKFCVLKLGTNFKDFNNKKSTRIEFFEKIRQRDYGTVYRQPHNFFSYGEHPQSECGPYFVYQVKVDLERRSGQIDVNIQEREKADGKGKKVEDETEARKTVQGKQRKTKEHKKEKSKHEKQRGKKQEKRKQEKRKKEKKKQESQRRENKESEKAKEHYTADKLGLAVITLSRSERKKMGLPIGVIGVLVKYVQSSSPASAAGLRKRDVIYAITHRSIASESDYNSRIRKKRNGDQLILSFWRLRGKKWEDVNEIVRLVDREQ